MCKVGGVTKVTDKNRDDVWLFLMVLGEYMSKYNTDGLGYAALDKNGALFGERWLINKSAFCDLSKMKGLTAEKINNIYSYFGTVKRQEASSIILHTRMATCERGIHNAHPFVNDIEKPTSAIIHNGVIGNHKELEKKYSTCDSEVIVHLYDKLGVNREFSRIKDVTQKLSGWYTVLSLTKDQTGRKVMDMFTDSGRLHSYFIPELDTRVYSTSSYDIEATAREIGATVTDHQAVSANTAFRVDCETGEQIEFIRTAPEAPTLDYGYDDDEAFVNYWWSRQ